MYIMIGVENIFVNVLQQHQKDSKSTPVRMYLIEQPLEKILILVKDLALSESLAKIIVPISHLDVEIVLDHALVLLDQFRRRPF